MNYFYFDSSTLVKHYTKEIGTELVVELCQKEGVNIIVSRIALVELGAAFARKLREERITESEYIMTLEDFRNDYPGKYIKINIDQDILDFAVYLVRKSALKAYDAVQLACAVQIKTVLMAKGYKADIAFVVADKVLEKAASDEGFVTINPEP